MQNIPKLSYVPTLGIRPSEMNGLEKLPGTTKDKLQPMILLAPWMGAGHLSRAIERVETAFSNRHYFLDLDQNYSAPDLSCLSPAQVEFEELKDQTGGYVKFFDFIKDYPFIYPCLQYQNLSKTDLIGQIKRIREMGRFFGVRVKTNNVNCIDDLIPVLKEHGAGEYMVLLEGEHVENALLLEVAFSKLIRKFDMPDNIQLIVSCTTIPTGFSEIENVKEVSFDNRKLVDQIRKTTNRNIVYGDWGSARPRDKSSQPQRRPLPRIDYPTKSSWLFSRHKEQGWNYSQAAKEIMNQPQWKSDGANMGVWGTDMILRTAKNQDIGINTPYKCVAARINIHLHLQAFYNESLPSIAELDEDYEDW